MIDSRIVIVAGDLRALRVELDLLGLSGRERHVLAVTPRTLDQLRGFQWRPGDRLVRGSDGSATDVELRCSPAIRRPRKNLAKPVDNAWRLRYGYLMATTTNTTTDYASVIDALVESGFEPTDQPAALVVAPGRCGSLPVAGADLRRKLQATVSYFAARGWDAVRLDPDELTFVRFSDEGHRITTTTASGVITAEATFSASPSGTRLFLAAAAA